MRKTKLIIIMTVITALTLISGSTFTIWAAPISSERQENVFQEGSGEGINFFKEPYLSEDGLTLYDAVPPILLLDDPEPNNQGIKIPQSQAVLAAIADPTSATASFQITYKSSGTSDPWNARCQPFPSQARAAFDAGAAIWANELQSSVPITISTCWSSDLPSNTLGYSGGGPIHRNFPGALKPNTWYMGSLANALNGADLDPSSFDMHITYNSNFSWYYGTDANPPTNQHDFVTVVAHEIGHGLNFMGSTRRSDSGIYSWGYNGDPVIFDTFLESGNGAKLTSFANGSSALGNLLTSNNLWWNGTNANAANGGGRVKMYAPSTWSSGSSIAHLDYDTYRGTINSLMVYRIASGSANHNIGPVTLGILQDMGWIQTPAVTNYTLTVTKAGSGSGTVTSTPAGINCGATCSASFPSGTSVTLTASPLAGSVFAGWSGACSGTSTTCIVAMTQAQSVTATFNTTDAPTTFADVPATHWAYQNIERLYQAGITTGCDTNPLRFCPENPVQRDQMALFILRGMYGGSYQPPAVGSSSGFFDVSTWHWAAAWIKQLAAVGITTGCGGGNYCPGDPVARDQMALFILRGMYGGSYQPPAVGASTGFNDVPTWHWAAAWIKQLAAEGITTGCGGGNYCPNDPVTRAQMAVFLVRAFIDRVPPDTPVSIPIKNGDFESGRDGSWTEFSSNGWNLIYHTSEMAQIPHGGQWAAWLGGAADETSRLSQVVSIPADQYYLHFHYYIGSEDVCGFDFAHIKVNNSTLLTFNLCENNATLGWLHQMVNLSPYAGSTVTLLFEVSTDSSENSSFYLDDVSLTSTVTAPPRDDTPYESATDSFLPKDWLLTPE